MPPIEFHSHGNDRENVGGDDFGGQLSGEKLELLDVGALVWFANPGPAAKVRESRVYRRLKVRTEGRDVFLPEKGVLYEATSFIRARPCDSPGR